MTWVTKYVLLVRLGGGNLGQIWRQKRSDTKHGLYRGCPGRTGCVILCHCSVQLPPFPLKSVHSNSQPCKSTMPAMAAHYTSSALSVASTLHAEVFLVATAIETHFRLCLLSATSMPFMLRRHHTLQLYLEGNIRCSIVPIHSTIYKRWLNISVVPCLPAPAPATALSEDRRREGGSRTIPRRDEFQIICYFPAAATSRGQKTVTFNRKSSRVAWTTDTV